MMNQGQQSHDEQGDALDALLAEALAPESARPELEERLVEAAVAAARPADAPLASIGPSDEAPRRWPTGLSGLAAAAAIALAFLGVWAFYSTDPAGTSVGEPDRLAMIERELADLEQTALLGTDPLDEQFELLALHLELRHASPLWPAQADPFEETMRDVHADHLLHELDLAWLH